jgi:hypothetical protein
LGDCSPTDHSSDSCLTSLFSGPACGARFDALRSTSLFGKLAASQRAGQTEQHLSSIAVVETADILD